MPVEGAVLFELHKFRKRMYKLPSSNQSILRYYTLRHIRIEINHGSQNVF
jgi:hypothetical protein